MPQVIRHHTVIVGVVSGLVLTVVTLAVCATCHQSRRERRRLHKLSTTTTEVPSPTLQPNAQLTTVDDRRIHDVTGTGSASTAQNHQPHGWMGLANGGQCIQRDDGLRLTSLRRVPDDRPHTAVGELPADDATTVSDRTRSGGRRLLGTVMSNTGPAVAARHGVVDKHGGIAGPPATISAVATIEKRPASPLTDSARESNTSPRPDVVLHDKFQYPPSRFAQQLAESTSPRRPRVVEVHGMDASTQGGRRICPGWSASVMPVVTAAAGAAEPGRSHSGTLARPNCIQTAPTISDRQWQRSASVRWTSSGSSSRRPATSAALSATRSTSELYDDVRPRLGATHSIVF